MVIGTLAGLYPYSHILNLLTAVVLVRVVADCRTPTTTTSYSLTVEAVAGRGMHGRQCSLFFCLNMKFQYQ